MLRPGHEHILRAASAARQGRSSPPFIPTERPFPARSFAFFGLSAVGQPYLPGVDLGTFMLASFAAYSVSSVMVFNYGVTIAIDRGQKIDLLSLAVLFGFATVTGVHLGAVTWFGMAARLLVGSIPFIALGFAIAYLCSPNSAPAVANLLYLVLAFGSGMLIRVDQMPEFLRTIAPFLPTYHYAELSWGVLGASSEDVLVSLAWLAGYTVVFFAVARWAYQREAASKFG